MELDEGEFPARQMQGFINHHKEEGRRPRRRCVVRFVGGQATGLAAIDSAQPQVIMPGVVLEIRMPHRIDHGVTGRRHDGCADPVDANEMFGREGFCKSRSRSSKADGETGDLAFHENVPGKAVHRHQEDTILGDALAQE